MSVKWQTPGVHTVGVSGFGVSSKGSQDTGGTLKLLRGHCEAQNVKDKM